MHGSLQKVTKMLYVAHHRQPFLREFKGNKNEKFVMTTMYASKQF